MYGWCADPTPFATRAAAWRAATPPVSYVRTTVLVPCAGADVLTPRVLFPNANKIVLVSREPVHGSREDEALRNATLACTRVGGYMIGEQVRRLAAREGILPLLRTVAAAAGLHVRTVRTVRPRRAVLSTAEGVRVEYVQDDALHFLAAWTSYNHCAVFVKGDEWVFADGNASPERACRTVVREGAHRQGVVHRNLTTRFGYCEPDPDGAVTAQRDRAERGQRLRCDLTIATATSGSHG